MRVDTLLTHLEDWVRGGASVRVSEYKTIDTDCEPAIATAEDMECEAPTQPPPPPLPSEQTTEDTKCECPVQPTQPCEETPQTSPPPTEGVCEDGGTGISVAILTGDAVASFIVGFLKGLLLIKCYKVVRYW